MMPLIAETLILAAIFYAIGVGIGWLFFGRPRRSSYLGD
jgi:hypothetical protein